VASVDESTGGEGPYAAFNAAVARETVGSYDGPLGRLGGGPDDVARTIEKAITKRRPRTRYPVTPSARLSIVGRRLLPDRAWDSVVGHSFPRPGG
jgi:hypothetical protein